jgi:uncharacterized pyridoxal phosphate-containing UPF0001 family protein
VAEAYAAGQFAFGENYVQEGIGKILALAALRLEWHATQVSGDDERSRSGVRPSAGVRQRDADGALSEAVELSQWSASKVVRPEAPRSGAPSPEGPLLRPLEWHHIGPIQSNKTAVIAEHFHWVHGVDRLKIAQRLSAARLQRMPPLQVCIQVNVSAEETKSGVRPDEVVALARAICGLPKLVLRGLMAIPEPTADVAKQRERFRLVREVRDETVRAGVPMDTLSMGMSDDLEAAIAEGATLVRIGRAIFGERPG